MFMRKKKYQKNRQGCVGFERSMFPPSWTECGYILRATALMFAIMAFLAFMAVYQQ